MCTVCTYDKIKLTMNNRRLGYVDVIIGRRRESLGFPFPSSVLILDKWDLVLTLSSVIWNLVGYLRTGFSRKLFETTFT